MTATLADLLRDKGMRLSDLAKALRINKSLPTRWSRKRVPAERVIEVEKATGIPRQEIRPDIYPPQDPFPGAAA